MILDRISYGFFSVERKSCGEIARDEVLLSS